MLEPRQGDGTYVTSLEPELLLAGTSFLSDLLTGPTLRELHQVRRILEPAATALATPRLREEDSRRSRSRWSGWTSAESTQAFIDADVDFHRVIVNACGNATLASLIQNLSGGTLRARVWRAIHERGAVESTRRLHHDIYAALQQRDAELAAATDLVHLAAGERWLQSMSEDGAGALSTPAPSPAPISLRTWPRSPSSRAPFRCRRSAATGLPLTTFQSVLHAVGADVERELGDARVLAARLDLRDLLRLGVVADHHEAARRHVGVRERLVGAERGRPAGRVDAPSGRGSRSGSSAPG